MLASNRIEFVPALPARWRSAIESLPMGSFAKVAIQFDRDAYDGFRDEAPSFDFYMIEAKPENRIGDRAYDSDPLDDDLRNDGIEMISPHRVSRKKRKTQDGRRLRRYERRWLVERFFAWIQWQRRLLVRWEYYAENFLGFAQVASIRILLRQF